MHHSPSINQALINYLNYSLSLHLCISKTKWNAFQQNCCINWDTFSWKNCWTLWKVFQYLIPKKDGLKWCNCTNRNHEKRMIPAVENMEIIITKCGFPWKPSTLRYGYQVCHLSFPCCFKAARQTHDWCLTWLLLEHVGSYNSKMEFDTNINSKRYVLFTLFTTFAVSPVVFCVLLFSWILIYNTKAW